MDIATIILSVSTALGGGGTVAYWRETHSVNFRKKRKDEIDAQLLEALHPVTTDLQLVHSKLDTLNASQNVVIQVAISEAMTPVRDQLAILNTKVEPLWTALINMGINQTNVLHQPDPRRAHIDQLLEELQAELQGGHIMTAEHFLELQHILTQIKGWEPGQDLGFPVLPAEPTSAAILLAIMGLSRVRRKHEQEHQ
jgi:hypothetical protein